MRNLFVLAVLGTATLVACSSSPPEAPRPPPAPQIVDFHTSSSTISTGAKVTLFWETKDATTIELFDSVRGKVSNVDALTGSVELVPVEDSLFVLTASNARGARVSAVVSVRIDEGARNIIFFASPSRIDAGAPSELAWSAPGARSVSLKAQNGAPIDLAGQLAEGSVTVRPEADSTYELTVDGKVKTTTVQVRPVILAFGATPDAAVVGLPVTLNWQTRGAVRVTIQALHTGEVTTETDPTKVMAGSYVETIPTEPDRGEVFSWRLSAFGTSPEAVSSTDVKVYISGTPRITSFVAPEYAREGGTFQINWETAETDQVVVELDGARIYVTPSKAEAASQTLTLAAPTQPVTLRLRAINFRGGEVEKTAPVSPVGTTSNMGFTASPQQIAKGGDPITLTWNLPNARRLKITANDGQYTVISQSGLGAEAGTATVYPNEDTVYSLVAHNTLGDEVTDSQSVVVPVKTGTIASPASPVGPNYPVDVSWNVPGGTEIYGLPHSQVEFRNNHDGFIDIRETGTKPAYSDTDFQTILIHPDFETWIFGQRAPAEFMVTHDGFLFIGDIGGLAPMTPQDLPITGPWTPRFVVAPFWADLTIFADGGMYWQVLGEAPEKVLVVQWDNVHVKDQPTTSLTFQAQIHQNGTIKFEYLNMNPGTAVGIVGIQGGTDVHYVQYAPGAVSDSGITFFGPVSAPAQVKLPDSSPVDGWVKIGDAYLKTSYTPTIVLPGQLRISEVMFHPAAAVSTTGEWFEVYNNTTMSVDTNGWQLDFGGGVTHQIDGMNGQTVIPPKGTLVFGQSLTAALNDNAQVQYAYGTSISMDDNAGKVELISGVPIASFEWSASMATPGRSVVSDPAAIFASGSSTCMSSKTFGSQAPLQTGTPGALSSCFAYGLSSIPENWEDISLTGTAVLTTKSSSSGYGPVTLPAPFTYFGTSYSEIQLAMSGLSSFGAQLTSAYRTSDMTPSSSAPNGVVAPFWESLKRNTGTGRLLVQRKSNYTIISWHDFAVSGSGPGAEGHLFFEEKLFDSGVIEFHYGEMIAGFGEFNDDAARTAGALATAWIEAPDGQSALPVSVHVLNGIQPNTAWRFTPSTP